MPQLPQSEHLGDHSEGTYCVFRISADFFTEPIHIGDAASIDDVVRQHCRDDLATKWVPVEGVTPCNSNALRKIVRQHLAVDLVVDRASRQQRGFQIELDVGHQCGEFRRRQPRSRLLGRGELLLGRKPFDDTVDDPARFEVGNHSAVHTDHRPRIRPRGTHQFVLRTVVCENEFCDLVGQRFE